MKKKDDGQMVKHLPVLAAVLSLCAILFFVNGGLDIFHAFQRGVAWQASESIVSLSMLLFCLVCLLAGKLLLFYEDRRGRRLSGVGLWMFLLLAIGAIIIAALPFSRHYILITLPSAALLVGALMLWMIAGLSILMLLEKDDE